MRETVLLKKAACALIIGCLGLVTTGCWDSPRGKSAVLYPGGDEEELPKIEIVSITDDPDPFNPALVEAVSLEAAFGCRPTDAGAGNPKHSKTFAIRVVVSIRDEGGAIVRELRQEFPFSYPEKLPASQYYAATCVLDWDGTDTAGGPLADGVYSYHARGTLVRYDELGNGNLKEKIVGASDTLGGTVSLDSTPPALSIISPAEGSTVSNPRPEIAVLVTDEVAGVDPESVGMLVLGEEVTPSYDPETGRVAYTPEEDLPEGTIEVTVLAGDLAGNTASISWQFIEDRLSVAFDRAASSGDSRASPVLVSVSLSRVPGRVVKVDYAATGGTASGGGDDYVLREGTLVFEADTVTKHISFEVMTNIQPEDDETVEIGLSDPVDVLLGDVTVHTYTILAFGIVSREALDTDGDARIDCIRIVTGAGLNDDFTGLGVTVGGYTLTGVDTGLVGNDNEFFVRVEEQEEPDVGVNPEVQVAENTSLAGAETGDLVPEDDAPVPCRDVTPPAVAETSPAYAATEVPESSAIRITFSEAMDLVAAEEAFSIEAVEGGFSWEGNTLVFAPAVNLDDDVPYTATVGTGAVDLAGNALESEFTLAFTTGPGLSVTIPAESAVSPVFIEGTYWSPDTRRFPITGSTATGAEVAADILDEKHLFVNVPLEPGANQVTVTNALPVPVSVSGQVTWTPTDIAGSSDSIMIRKGDSLLLTATGTGSVLEIDAEGDGTFVEVPGGPEGTLIAEYPAAGAYTASAKIDGEFAGAMLVVVVDVDLDKPVACEVDFRRQLFVAIEPIEYRSDVCFGTVDPAYLGEIEICQEHIVEDDREGVLLYLKALQRGTPVLTARIGGEAGPIVAYRQVDEFTLEQTMGPQLIVNADTGTALNRVTMRPFIEALQFTFELVDTTCTFEGGETSVTVSTTTKFGQTPDAVTGETIGIYDLVVNVPAGDTKAVIDVTVEQRGSDWKWVGADMVDAEEGACRVRVEVVKVGQGTDKDQYIEVEQTDIPMVGASIMWPDLSSNEPIAVWPFYSDHTDVDLEREDMYWQKVSAPSNATRGWYDVFLQDLDGHRLYFPYSVCVGGSGNYGRMDLPTKYHAVDIHGVPVPKASPTGEGESDRKPSIAEINMLNLSMTYNVTDASVPVEGGELALEFRRTCGVRRYSAPREGDPKPRVYPPDFILGPGWDTNIGSRVIFAERGGPLGSAHYATVIDEVGHSYTYMEKSVDDGTEFVPDTWHNLSADAHRAKLWWHRRDMDPDTPDVLMFRKKFGTTLQYVEVGRYSNPVSSTTSHEFYFRLDSITDRNGNVLRYVYQSDANFGDGWEDVWKFLPVRAYEDAHSERSLEFSYVDSSGGTGYTGSKSHWRLFQVSAPLGQLTTYEYTEEGEYSDPCGFGKLLAKVVRPDDTEVLFAYTKFDQAKPDYEDQLATGGTRSFWVAPTTITDAMQHSIEFEYGYEKFPAPFSSLGTVSKEWQWRLCVTSVDAESTVVDGAKKATFVVGPCDVDHIQTYAIDTRETTTTYDFYFDTRLNSNNRYGVDMFTKWVERTTQDESLGNPCAVFYYSLDCYGNLLAVEDLSGNHIMYDYGDGGDDTAIMDMPARRVLNPWKEGILLGEAVKATYSAEDQRAAYSDLLIDLDLELNEHGRHNDLNLVTTYGYDDIFNKLTSVTDAQGKTTTYELDVCGNRTAVIEAEERITRYYYVTEEGEYQDDEEGYGFVYKIVDPDGRETVFERVFNTAQLLDYYRVDAYQNGYLGSDDLLIHTITVSDVMGNKRIETDGRRQDTIHDYDSMNRLSRTDHPPVAGVIGHTWYTYDANGNLKTVKDELFNTTTNRYDDMNRLTYTCRDGTDPLVKTDYTYNAVGLQETVTDGRGTETVFSYDSLLRLVTKTTADCQETYRYGENSGSGVFSRGGWQPTRVINYRGLATDTVYDKAYRAIGTVRRSHDNTGCDPSDPPAEGEPAVLMQYDRAHNKIIEIVLNEDIFGDPANRVTYTFYDDLHRPVFTVLDLDGDGNIDGNPGRDVDDTDGDLYFDVLPSPWRYGCDSDDIVTQTVYDLAGNVTAVIDAEGGTTSYLYDGAGRLDAVHHPDGGTTSYVLDANGNRAYVKDPRGNWTRNWYDARNRLTMTVVDMNGDGDDGAGHPIPSGFDTVRNGPDIVTETEYDLAGNARFQTDGNGNRTEMQYDAANRMWLTIGPAVGMQQPRTETVYDENSNVTDVVDAEVNVTHTEYDAFNRPTEVTQAEGTAEATVTRTLYDQNGNVTHVILNSKVMSHYEYDEFDRQTTETRIGRRVAETAYDRAGNVTYARDPEGQYVRSAYDLAGRLFFSRHYDSAGSTKETRLFTYDRAGNVTTAAEYADILHPTFLKCVTSYTYDSMYRVLTETKSGVPGQADYTVTSSYDENGNRETVAYPGRSLTSEYDAMNRLKKVREGGDVTVYHYDDNGNRLWCSLPNGLVHSYTYDELNRVKTCQTVSAAVVGVTDGQRGTVTDNGDGTVTYTPDSGVLGVGLDTFDVILGVSGVPAATRTVAVNVAQKLLDPTGTESDYFGAAVSKSGKTAVVGAPCADFGVGAAWIFERTGTLWSAQPNKLVPDGTAADTRMGTAVAATDTTVVVTSRDTQDYQGAAYVYAKDGGVWTRQAKLLSDSPDPSGFGTSVAISGDTIVVGAPGGAGSLHVFEWNGADWLRTAKLSAAEALDLGRHVAVDGDTLVASASSGAGLPDHVGAAYVFSRDAAGLWSQEAMLTAPAPTEWSGFGSSVSVLGDTIAVGACYEASSGAVYVFTRDSGGGWGCEARLEPWDRDLVLLEFGRSVALSDGALLVGAPVPMAGPEGAAYVFRREGPEWSGKQKLMAPDVAEDWYFGGAVATSNGTALVGSQYDEELGRHAGAAYVFDISGPPAADLHVTTLTATPVTITAEALAAEETLYECAYKEYDKVGNRKHIIERVLRADGAGYDERDISYTYDKQYRLKSEVWQSPLGNESYSYDYDANGNRVSMTHNGLSTTYQLTDPDPTRLMGWWRTDGVSCDYAYDPNGNRVSKTVTGGADAGTTSYEYDTFDRLIEVRKDGTLVFAAEYDYRTRRILKLDPGPNGGDLTYFRYDGGVSFDEMKDGVKQVELIRGSGMGGGIGSILYSDRPGEGREHFVFNAVGHTVATVNTDGSVKSTNLYEAFGNIVEALSSGTSLNNRLANTKERDSTIDLDNHGFRYYDPEVGRYTTRDPVGYGAGMNVYLHVGSNPVNHVDPLGLNGWKARLAALFARQSGNPPTSGVAAFSLAAGLFNVAAQHVAETAQQEGRPLTAGTAQFAAEVYGMAERATNIPAQVEEAVTEYETYRETGMSAYESATMTTAQRLPLVNIPIKATEVATRQSLSGVDIGRELTTTETVSKTLTAGGETLLWGAAAAAHVKAGGAKAAQEAAAGETATRGGETVYTKYGRLKHGQLKKLATSKPGWRTGERFVDPKTGKTVVPDTVSPKGRPVELKPKSSSGIQRGRIQKASQIRATGATRGRVIYYEPPKLE